MSSVTQRIKEINQPRGGYINPRSLHYVDLDDGIKLIETENIQASIVGLAVDYLSRFVLGAPAEDAFSISLLGARIIGDEHRAFKLLKKISCLNRRSIIAACKLVGYDVCYRASPFQYRPVQAIKPDKFTIKTFKPWLKGASSFLKSAAQLLKTVSPLRVDTLPLSMQGTEIF